MSFIDLYHSIRIANKSYVCLGLDSDISKLPNCLKKDDNPIWRFNKEIIDATKTLVAAYKPNFAFYLSAGKKGLLALEKTLEYIPQHIPVILDCKVGDIGNTMEHYAEAFFSEMNVSAITVNPLMGKDVFNAVLNKDNRYIFVLALTSNPSASDYLKPNDLYKKLAKDIHQLGSCKAGAVVGATQTEDLEEMRKMMPETLFLIPGIGAQGGSLSDVAHNAKISQNDPGFLINSSRAIIFADNSEKFAESAYNSCEQLRGEINQLL